MKQEQAQQQHVGLMQSKPLEASPVQSNTTLQHDGLGGAVARVCSTESTQHDTACQQIEQLVLALRFLWNERARISLASGVPCASGLSHSIIQKLLQQYSHIPSTLKSDYAEPEQGPYQYKAGDTVRCVEATDTFDQYEEGSVGTVYDVDVCEANLVQRVFVHWNGSHENSVFAWPDELELVKE